MKACQQLEDDFLGLAGQNIVCGESEVCCPAFATHISQHTKRRKVRHTDYLTCLWFSVTILIDPDDGNGGSLNHCFVAQS